MLSVLVPVYNEERSIEAVLRRVVATPVEKEVIVINDGSTDGTSTILSRLSTALPIQRVTHDQNRGKGAAIRSGFSRSRGDILLVQDADFECDPSHYPSLLEPFTDPAVMVVYGSRFLRPTRASFGLHRLANRTITTWVRLFFGGSLTDAETGYKVFRRRVFEPLALRAKRFEFEVEFTCKVLRQGYAITEVSVAYLHRRSYTEGKKITWKDGVYALWVILCCRINPRY